MDTFKPAAQVKKRCDAAYVAILGHSENGVVRFPDGSWLTLTEMARQCVAQGKRCIFPGCITSAPPEPDRRGPGSTDSLLCARDPTDPLRSVGALIGRGANGVSLAEIVTANLKSYGYPMSHMMDRFGRSSAVIGLILSLEARPRRDPKLTYERPAGSNQEGPGTRCFPLNSPRPNYTEDARRDKVQGTVRLRILVGADGKVRQFRVVSGSPDGLNEEALLAAAKLRFRPAMKAGVPVEIWQAVDIDFNLR
jgi:TonB family protein